jgi:hypothetical protein
LNKRGIPYIDLDGWDPTIIITIIIPPLAFETTIQRDTISGFGRVSFRLGEKGGGCYRFSNNFFKFLASKPFFTCFFPFFVSPLWEETPEKCLVGWGGGEEGGIPLDTLIILYYKPEPPPLSHARNIRYSEQRRFKFKYDHLASQNIEKKINKNFLFSVLASRHGGT